MMVIDKKFNWFIIQIFILGWALAQQKPKSFTLTNEMLTQIQTDIKKIEKGWLSNDFTVSIQENLVHPKILDMAGGKEALIENTQLQMQEMGNFSITKLTFEQPKDFVIYKEVIYGIIPFKMEISFDTNKVHQNSYLLVLSENQGKSFYYFDAEGLKNPIIENLFPDIKNAIKLPQ